MNLFRTKKMLIGLTAGVVAGLTSLSVPSPAHAAVVPVNFENNGIALTALQSVGYIECGQFDLAGAYDDVDNTGVLDDLTSDNCWDWSFGHTLITQNGAWDFALGSNISGTVFNASLTSVTAFVYSPYCSYNIAGGIDGEFDTSTQTFEATSSTVTIYDIPVGPLCPYNGVAQGQDIDIDGNWTNTGTPITLP
jgi:hypothetical protein